MQAIPISKASQLRLTALAAGVAGAMAFGNAQAFPIDAGPNWQVHWDNTLSYNLGFRMKNIDDGIGDNPAHHESDYKFKDKGDIVTNRVSVLSEFDAVYDGRHGVRVSASAWRDFAYDDDVEFNPDYAMLLSRSDGKFGSDTKKYYVRGADLLDAFVFTNFELDGRQSSLRAGRLTQYWGNSLFFGSQGISYSQNAQDLIKAAATPGTQAKELAIPRAQLLFSTQLTPSVAMSAQYFFEFQENLLPEGGTYLGVAGFLFQGPDQAFGGQMLRGRDDMPDHVNDNFGLNLMWNPQGFNGTIGAHYRQFDETQPWVPLLDVVGGQTFYRLGYNEGVKLYGLSMDVQLGPYSTGFEASYRKGTALNSIPGVNVGEGARGDTLNLIANVVGGLTPSALYDTGTWLAEVGYTRKLKVTDNKELYNGEGTAGCVGKNKWDGCSTDDAVQVAMQFTPQWLQVAPGIDLDAPITVIHGLSGNGASLSSGNQGSTIFIVGLHALIHQKYNVTVAYNGYNSHTKGKTGPTGLEHYASGNGTWMYNDKDWLSLTFSTSF